MLKDHKDLSELLLLQRIKVKDDKLYLENGTTLSFNLKEQDSSSADISWYAFDAFDDFEEPITSVEYNHKYDWSRNKSEVTITLYNDEIKIAEAEAYAKTNYFGYYSSAIEVNVESIESINAKSFTLLDCDTDKDYTITDDETNTDVDKFQPLLDDDLSDIIDLSNEQQFER